MFSSGKYLYNTVNFSNRIRKKGKRDRYIDKKREIERDRERGRESEKKEREK